jgi:hypothetical protein
VLDVVLALGDAERPLHLGRVDRLDVAQPEQAVRPPGALAALGARPQSVDRVDHPLAQPATAPTRRRARLRADEPPERVGLQVHRVVQVRQGVAHMARELWVLGRTVQRFTRHRPAGIVPETERKNPLVRMPVAGHDGVARSNDRPSTEERTACRSTTCSARVVGTGG